MFSEKEEIQGPKLISRKWPVNITEEDKSLFESEQLVQLDATNVFTYRNKYVNEDGIVFSYLKLEKECLIWPSHSSIYTARYLAKEHLRNKTRSLGKNKTGIVCFDYWSNGYFHWICEALPRIILAEQRLKEPDTFLLLPEKFRQSYPLQTLKSFPGINIEWIKKGEQLKCEKLLLFDRVAPSGSNNPDNIAQLQKKIGTDAVKETVSRNIYVSRKKADRRKVINEEQVISLLEKYGFEIICYEDYSFDEQVQLATTVKNCISIHGANLTNTLFMSKGANVLELRMKGDKENNYYYALAEACNVNYYYLSCRFEILATAGNNFNLEVDINELERITKLMIA